jgi:hypothetical protein
MVAIKVEEDDLKDAKLYGWLMALALPTNIRLGWKSLPRTNSIAYRKKFYKIGYNVYFISILCV